MAKLIDPLGILGGKKEVVARFDNDVAGVCPVCGTQMKILIADTIPSYTCLTDRICLPTKDSSCLLTAARSTFPT